MMLNMMVANLCLSSEIFFPSQNNGVSLLDFFSPAVSYVLNDILVLCGFVKKVICFAFLALLLNCVEVLIFSC